jgi:hypothetical protein
MSGFIDVPLPTSIPSGQTRYVFVRAIRTT